MYVGRLVSGEFNREVMNERLSASVFGRVLHRGICSKQQYPVTEAQLAVSDSGAGRAPEEEGASRLHCVATSKTFSVASSSFYMDIITDLLSVAFRHV